MLRNLAPFGAERVVIALFLRATVPSHERPKPAVPIRARGVGARLSSARGCSRRFDRRLGSMLLTVSIRWVCWRSGPEGDEETPVESLPSRATGRSRYLRAG